jgi:hypothetical protein
VDKLANTKSTNGTAGKSDTTATREYLRAGIAGVQAWCADNPIKQNIKAVPAGVNDDGTERAAVPASTKTLTRKTIAVTANCEPELFGAIIEAAACGREGFERKYVSEGDLQYNALSIAVLAALHNAYQAYEPEGYKFELGEVGQRAGTEGVTAKLRVAETQVNELVVFLVGMVSSGKMDIDQVPEGSRAAVLAAL